MVSLHDHSVIATQVSTRAFEAQGKHGENKACWTKYSRGTRETEHTFLR